MYKKMESNKTMQQTVVDALFRDVSLTRQALFSFDDFTSRIVPEVVENHRPLVIKSDLNCYDSSAPVHTIRIDSVRYDVPSTVEKNGDIRLSTPMEARNRDLMYSAPMYVNVHHEHMVDGHVKTDVFKDVYFARMPVMVRSSLCSLNSGDDYEKGECPHDPGGYFVVNGREKTLVVQERISPNIIFCFNPSECLYHAEYDRVAHRVATLRVKVRKFGSAPFKVHLPGIEVGIPIIILWRAIGGQDDEYRLHLDPQDVRTSEEDAIVAKTTEEALEWLGTICEDPAALLERRVYPNIEPSMKAEQLILQWRIYLDCLYKRVPYHDRDHVRAKRLDTAGAMLGTMFTHLFYQMLGNIRKMAIALLNKNKKLRPHRLIQPQHITDGIKYALATGNWKIKNSAFAGRVGVSQLLNRNTYISCISQLRRVDTGIDSQQKIIAPRLLYGNQWGYMCPSETPEGGPCGLVKQLALSAYITTQCDFGPIEKIITPRLVESAEKMVFHNGGLLGYCHDISKLACDLRSARQSRVISSDACVAIEDGHLCVWTDSGRVSRPVFVVKDGSVTITPEQISDLEDGRLRWDDLFSLGIVENLSIYEEEAALIALRPDSLTSKHSHCELDPALILGTLASTIPYPDHNQSPRNVYQAAMGKQAMGVYASNFSKRFDTNGHIMHYPQKPLVTTRVAKALCGDELPAGMQAIVAIMCFGGYNQEDSLLFNRSAVDRGFGRSTTFRTYSSSNASSRQAPASEFKKQETYGSVNDSLDTDGLTFPGTEIAKGKAIFCNVTPGKKYPHIVKNKKSSGVVDKTILFQNANGGQTAKTRIREQRIPEMGDKFSSVCFNSIFLYVFVNFFYLHFLLHFNLSFSAPWPKRYNRHDVQPRRPPIHSRRHCTGSNR
jgi:DNA-directed RNA polymerase II subunit RPB2